MKKLKPDTDLNRFIRAVAGCADDVLFTTAEGDILNLHSTLSSYIFAALSGRQDLLSCGRIDCSPQDLSLLGEFLFETDE